MKRRGEGRPARGAPGAGRPAGRGGGAERGLEPLPARVVGGEDGDGRAAWNPEAGADRTAMLGAEARMEILVVDPVVDNRDPPRGIGVEVEELPAAEAGVGDYAAAAPGIEDPPLEEVISEVFAQSAEKPA